MRLRTRLTDDHRASVQTENAHDYDADRKRIGIHGYGCAFGRPKSRHSTVINYWYH